VLACNQAAPHGWTSAEVLVPAIVGLVGGAAFVLRQSRTPNPLLPLSILTDRRRATAYLATAISVVGTFGMFLMLTYHFQVVLGYSPLQTGLAFLPLNIAVVASSYGLGSRLMDRVSARAMVTPALVVAAAGLGLLTQLEPGSGYLTLILPAEILVGAGVGCIFTPSIGVATSGIEPRQAGIAAATANAAMQVGGSIGIAVLNTVAVAAASGYAGTHVEAMVHGSATANAGAAIALLVTAGVAALGLRPAPATVGSEQTGANR